MGLDPLPLPTLVRASPALVARTVQPWPSTRGGPGRARADAARARLRQGRCALGRTAPPRPPPGAGVRDDASASGRLPPGGRCATTGAAAAWRLGQGLRLADAPAPVPGRPLPPAPHASYDQKLWMRAKAAYPG